MVRACLHYVNVHVQYIYPLEVLFIIVVVRISCPTRLSPASHTHQPLRWWQLWSQRVWAQHGSTIAQYVCPAPSSSWAWLSWSFRCGVCRHRPTKTIFRVGQPAAATRAKVLAVCVSKVLPLIRRRQAHLYWQGTGRPQSTLVPAVADLWLVPHYWFWWPDSWSDQGQWRLARPVTGLSLCTTCIYMPEHCYMFCRLQ